MKERSYKEIINNLEFLDMYDVIYLIEKLKKENSNLKRKITRMKKNEEKRSNK